MKNYVIDLPGCLGDILFTLKIAEEFSKKGNVYWNIFPVFWHNGIDRVISSANIGPNQPLYIEGAEVLKLRDLCPVSDPNLMIKKYQTVGIDWEDWSNYLKYERYIDKENSLFERLNLERGEPFILYNENLGQSGSKHLGVINSLPKNYDGKIIKLEVIPDFSVFDWCSIFEQAEQIHTVDTSIIFIMETLTLKSSKLVIHPRNCLYTKSHLSILLNKPWEWVEYKGYNKESWSKISPSCDYLE